MSVKTMTWAMVVAAAIATASVWSQEADVVCCEPTAGESPYPGGNLGNQNYSSLDAINRNTIQDLGPAWRVNVSAMPPATDDTGSQATPIAVDGVIYLPTPSGGVIAVDGATGENRWKYQPEWADGFAPRGFSIGEGRLYTTGEDDRVVALDPATGEEIWVTEQPTAPDGSVLEISSSETALLYHDGLIFGGTRGDRAAAFALNSDDGSVAWVFYGGADFDTVVTDVNGNTIDAGATWGPGREDGTSCAIDSGATPWRHAALDPELRMVYYTFGNARSCHGSQDGSGRPGQNLFSSTLVALDVATGEYRWHFQSIHHDIWDMDNVHPPLLADVSIDGETRQAIYYGSKSGHLFVLDRSNGRPLLPVEERPVPQDSRQGEYPTQPFPNGRPLPECLVYQPLDPATVPGDPWRAVPNYNGYQVDATGRLVYTEPNYLTADEPFVTYPPGYDATHRRGCLYDTHWDLPVLSTSSQNGGGDWSLYSFSHNLGLVYFPYGVNPVAHWRDAGGNGQRARGQYQTGGIVAMDASTNTVAWRHHLGLDMGHGQSPLSTAGDLLFVGQFDGNFLALDAATGDELWRFQTGAGISSTPITYAVDGVQYVAVFAAGTGNPYGGQVTRGDSLWAFRLGGTYTTESGSSEAPTTPPLTIRRPVSGDPVEGGDVGNTIYLARASRTGDTVEDRDSTEGDGMNPTHLRVPVGTTVTFLNPGAETFPNFPNELPHCATQYFEGLFNPMLQPGERFEYTFDRAGEYFFNDCTDPRPTGKVEVYLTPDLRPGALSFPEDVLDLGSPTGVFTGVEGVVTAHFAIPDGYTFEGDVTVTAPLSEMPFPAASARVEGGGRTLVAEFLKADLDNNVPEGASVPLTVTATFLLDGVQTQLSSSAEVTITK